MIQLGGLKLLPTWGFVQAGLDVQTSAVLHRCTLVRAGRNFIGLLVVILYFYFFIGLQFRADGILIPHHRQYLDVSCHKFRPLQRLTIIN
jgi:hypothetical protein